MSELNALPFEEEVETTEHHVIKDDQEAEWAIQQIKNANEEKAKWKQFYEERFAAVCETCDLTIANMESMLQSYFDTVPHKKTETQENYPLPGGKLVFKKQEPEYRREDADVIDWLKKNNGEKYIKTKETLDWASMKKSLNVLDGTVADENGVIIPCIEVVERPSLFKVELKKEK